MVYEILLHIYLVWKSIFKSNMNLTGWSVLKLSGSSSSRRPSLLAVVTDLRPSQLLHLPGLGANTPVPTGLSASSGWNLVLFILRPLFTNERTSPCFPLTQTCTRAPFSRTAPGHSTGGGARSPKDSQSVNGQRLIKGTVFFISLNT